MTTSSSAESTAVRPFESLEEMRSLYNKLVRGYGKVRGSGRGEERPGEFLREVDEFIARGRETGTLLDNPDERMDAQSMLNFWATVVYRYRTIPEAEPPTTTLAEFGRTPPPEERAAPAPFLAPPVPPGMYVGRELFLSDLKQQLLAPADIALYGPLGAGMSYIAANLANDPELRETFRDGVLWTSLGDRPDVSAVLNRWGEALGLSGDDFDRFTDVEHRRKVIRRALARGRTLLVIDDAWHVEPALALKLGGPHCAHVLTTCLMHVALGFDTDGTVAVPGLTEPEGLRLLTLHAPEAAGAEGQDARPVVDVLDGSPMALRLIAKYLHLHARPGAPAGLEGLHSELLAIKESFKTSPAETTGDAQAPPPLLAAVAWCYGHVAEDERRALLALSLFPPKPNSFSADAARAVAGENAAAAVERLVSYSLLEPGGAGRYAIHRAVSGYLKRLPESRERAGQAGRMVEFYLGLVREHSTDLQTLQQEEKNILAALELAAADWMPQELIEATLKLLGYFDRKGLYALAKEWLGRALKAARLFDDSDSQKDILLNLGEIEERLSEYDAAAEHLKAALDYARDSDARAAARALQGLGVVAMALADYDQARRLLMEALELAANDPGGRDRVCALYTRLGWLERGVGRFKESREFSEKGLRIAREEGDDAQIAELLLSLGVLSYFENKYDEAKRLYVEGLRYAERADDSRLHCGLLQALGGVEVGLGNYEAAEGTLLEALRISREIGHRWYSSVIWKELGELRLRQNYLNAATEALTKSLEIARDVNSPEQVGLALYGLARTAAARANYAEARLQGQTSLNIFETAGHEKAQEVRGWLNTLPRQA